VLLVGLASAAALRSRLSSSALRESLEATASAQLGIELESGELGLRLWPPVLELRAPVVELAGGVRLELAPARIEVALAPLLDGVAEVRRLSLAGPARLVHRRGELAGQLVLELAPGAAPGVWLLRAEAELRTGGRIAARGELGGGGRFAGSVEIEDVEATPFAAFLYGERGEAASASGRYRGRFEWSEPGLGPTTLRLASDETVLELAPVRLEGAVALQAELPASQVSDPGGGRFELDATRARVDYAGSFAKASGRGASLRGGIVRESDRIRLSDLRLKVLRFEGEVAAPGERELP
jgi:hypothetical protein